MKKEKQKFLEFLKSKLPFTLPEIKLLNKIIFISEDYIQINAFSKSYIKNSRYFERLNTETIQLKKNFLILLKKYLKELYPQKKVYCVYKEKIDNEKENT